jgi:hypothetical protein
MSELALKPEFAVSTQINYEEDEGAGLENLTTKDISIPFIAILQQLSPQLKKGPSKIDGAEEGNIYNPVTQEVIGDEGIEVIPCAYQKKWVEWKPREVGGGVVHHHDSDEILSKCTPDSKNNEILPNGNIVVATAYYYVLVRTAGQDWTKAIISMTKTQMKKSKKWNSLMGAVKQKRADGTSFTPAMYSRVYKLSTIQEEKNNHSWYGWNIHTVGPVDSKEVYEIAKALNKDVMKGEVKAKPIDEQEFSVEAPESNM